MAPRGSGLFKMKTRRVLKPPTFDVKRGTAPEGYCGNVAEVRIQGRAMGHAAVSIAKDVPRKDEQLSGS